MPWQLPRNSRIWHPTLKRQDMIHGNRQGNASIWPMTTDWITPGYYSWHSSAKHQDMTHNNRLENARICPVATDWKTSGYDPWHSPRKPTGRRHVQCVLNDEKVTCMRLPHVHHVTKDVRCQPFDMNWGQFLILLYIIMKINNLVVKHLKINFLI